MRIFGKLSIVFWLGVLGYLGLYVWVVAMGLLGPGEVAALTVLTVALAAMFAVHAVRVHHAMRDHSDPAHEGMMRELHRYRERRGF
jgi:hypothetical protein